MIRIDPVFFYLVALVILATAVYAVSSPKLINAALSLALSFFAIGGLYALLGSPFLAILQVLVNAGAIPIVTIFIIMMTQSRVSRVRTPSVAYYAVAAAALLLVAFRTVPQVASHAAATGRTLVDVTPVGTAMLGERLLSSPQTNGQAGTLLAFELASVILLVAMVGAIVLARRDGETIKGDVGLETVDTPVRAGEAPLAPHLEQATPLAPGQTREPVAAGASGRTGPMGPDGRRP